MIPGEGCHKACEIQRTWEPRVAPVMRPASPLRARIFRAASYALLLFWVPVLASGQAPKEGRKASVPQKDVGEKRDESRGGKKVPVWSVEREAEAMAFVQQHQPELARLLAYLRRHDPRQYQRAVRELVRASERLAQTRQRDARRYELELQAWKTRSRIDLLAAQWQIHPSDELRERLQAAVTQQLAQQKSLLLSERERLSQRLEKLDTQLQMLDAQQPEEIERRMRVLTDARRKKVAGPHGKRSIDANEDQH